MSVSLFDEERMINLHDQLNGHMKIIEGVIRHSKIFQNHFIMKLKFSRGKSVDESKLIKEILIWLFQRLTLANCFAYISTHSQNYGTYDSINTIIKNHGKWPYKTESASFPVPLDTIYSKLTHLNYNITDQTGHRWLPIYWAELFDNIINRIANEVVEKLASRHEHIF